MDLESVSPMVRRVWHLHSEPRSLPVLLRLICLTATTGACVLLVGLGPRSPDASAAAPTTCRLSTSEQRSLGPTYVTLLRVTGTSCASGKTLVRAFHRCRRSNGGVFGRCRKPVRGFACTEKRGSIPTQLSGKVTCTRGGVVVLHTYTQLT